MDSAKYDSATPSPTDGIDPADSPNPNDFTDPADSPGASGSGGDGNSAGSCEPPEKLLKLSHTAVACPIGDCSGYISQTSLLSHCLCNHVENADVQYREIHAERPTTMIFAPTAYRFRENVPLGMLLYTGLEPEPKKLPAERGLSPFNAFLPKSKDYLSAHLPIMIMACRTSWSAMLQNKQLAAKYTDPNNESQHILIIWLVSVQTSTPVHCTLTVYDKHMDNSRSCITKVRGLHNSQDPCDFLNSETSYMLLTYHDIRVLSLGTGEALHLEVVLHEYDR